MKCLICRKEMPLATESSPRTFAAGNYYGACAEHFPARHRLPEEWDAKFLEFRQLAEAAAKRRPASPAQKAASRAIIKKHGPSVHLDPNSVHLDPNNVQAGPSVRVEQEP